MKKLLAVILVAAFATVAYAEDRLKLNGEVRVRGFSWQDKSFTKDKNEDYFDMRLRLGGDIEVDKDVKAVFRMDLAEEKFGVDGKDSNRYADIQVDKAYIDVNKAAYRLKAGQQGYRIGNVVDHTGAGFILDAKLPVTLSLMFTKIDENGAVSDEEDEHKDKDVYGAQVRFKNDTLDARLFGAYLVDKKYDEDDKQTAIGAAASAKLGIVKIEGELDFFTGDKADSDVSYTGLQTWVNVSAKVSDMITVGSEFVYAAGTDDADEEQITYLTYDKNFLVVPYGDGDAELLGSPFEVDTNAGSIGLIPYVKIKPMADLELAAKLAYLMPETDSVTDVNSLTSVTLKGTYKFAKNTKLVLEYDYADKDEDGVSSEASQLFFMKIATKF